MRVRIAMLIMSAVLAMAAPVRAEVERGLAEVSAECLAADALVVGKLEPIRTRQGVGGALSLGDVLAALSRARALCDAGEPERGLLVYIRISDALSNAAAIMARARH